MTRRGFLFYDWNEEAMILKTDWKLLFDFYILDLLVQLFIILRNKNMPSILLKFCKRKTTIKFKHTERSGQNEAAP